MSFLSFCPYMGKVYKDKILYIYKYLFHAVVIDLRTFGTKDKKDIIPFFAVNTGFIAPSANGTK